MSSIALKEKQYIKNLSKTAPSSTKINDHPLIHMMTYTKLSDPDDLYGGKTFSTTYKDHSVDKEYQNLLSTAETKQSRKKKVSPYTVLVPYVANGTLIVPPIQSKRPPSKSATLRPTISYNKEFQSISSQAHQQYLTEMLSLIEEELANLTSNNNNNTNSTSNERKSTSSPSKLSRNQLPSAKIDIDIINGDSGDASIDPPLEAQKEIVDGQSSKIDDNIHQCEQADVPKQQSSEPIISTNDESAILFPTSNKVIPPISIDTAISFPPLVKRPVSQELNLPPLLQTGLSWREHWQQVSARHGGGDDESSVEESLTGSP